MEPGRLLIDALPGSCDHEPLRPSVHSPRLATVAITPPEGTPETMPRLPHSEAKFARLLVILIQAGAALATVTSGVLATTGVTSTEVPTKVGITRGPVASIVEAEVGATMTGP